MNNDATKNFKQILIKRCHALNSSISMEIQKISSPVFFSLLTKKEKTEWKREREICEKRKHKYGIRKVDRKYFLIAQKRQMKRERECGGDNNNFSKTANFILANKSIDVQIASFVTLLGILKQKQILFNQIWCEEEWSLRGLTHAERLDWIFERSQENISHFQVRAVDLKWYFFACSKCPGFISYCPNKSFVCLDFAFCIRFLESVFPNKIYQVETFLKSEEEKMNSESSRELEDNSNLEEIFHFLRIEEKKMENKY